MTDFVLRMNMTNAAFSEFPCAEAARILRDLANRIEDTQVDSGDGVSYALRDVNGNMVGQAFMSIPCD